MALNTDSWFSSQELSGIKTFSWFSSKEHSVNSNTYTHAECHFDVSLVQCPWHGGTH